VGIIHGGTAHNITAKDCTFILSARCIPEEPVQDWLDRMREEILRVEQGMKASARRPASPSRRAGTSPALSPRTTARRRRWCAV
jgi:acetylornithine deacetylase